MRRLLSNTASYRAQKQRRYLRRNGNARLIPRQSVSTGTRQTRAEKRESLASPRIRVRGLLINTGSSRVQKPLRCLRRNGNALLVATQSVNTGRKQKPRNPSSKIIYNTRHYTIFLKSHAGFGGAPVPNSVPVSMPITPSTSPRSFVRTKCCSRPTIRFVRKSEM